MSTLDGNVSIAGKTFPKKAVAIGVGGVVAVAAYVYYQRRNATVDSNTTTDPTAATDQIDPATGFAYGSAEDAQALAEQANYDTGSEYLTSPDGSTYYNPQTGATTATITTNSQWENVAQSRLEDNGRDGQSVAHALSLYLTGSAVEKGSVNDSIIGEAIASTGLPPQSGPQGFPPSIRHVAAHSQKPPKFTVHHTVKHGETLSLLAQFYYGDSRKWADIKRDNRSRLHPRVGPATQVKPGTVLVIHNAITQKDTPGAPFKPEPKPKPRDHKPQPKHGFPHSGPNPPHKPRRKPHHNFLTGILP